MQGRATLRTIFDLLSWKDKRCEEPKESPEQYRPKGAERDWRSLSFYDIEFSQALKIIGKLSERPGQYVRRTVWFFHEDGKERLVITRTKLPRPKAKKEGSKRNRERP